MTKKKAKKKKKVRQKMQGDGRIYSYRASPPTTEMESVQEQFRLAHRYRNRLVELDLIRRRATDDALRKMRPKLMVMELELGPYFPRKVTTTEHIQRLIRDWQVYYGDACDVSQTLNVRIWEAETEEKQRRVRQRGRKPDPEVRKAIRALRAKRAALYKQYKALRAKVFASAKWKKVQERINEADTATCKAARAESGLYWGSYLQVEQAASSFRRGAPPRFRRWEGCGKIAVQLQQGLSIDKLVSCTDRRLRLQREPDGVWVQGTRRLRKLGNAVASLRIGSKGRSPIFAEIPIRFHRPLPETAKIKWCWLLMRRRGTKTLWYVQFVLEAASGAWAASDLAKTRSVGIDVGWRRFKDGRLRAAVCAGSDKSELELCLPAWWVAEMRRTELIQGYRDKMFDEVKIETKAWVQARKEGLPDWLVDAAKHMHQWRSQSRLAGLSLRWREVVGESGEEATMLAHLEAWRVRDKHLYEFQAHLRSQLQGSRLDLYRKFAARISRQYKTAVIENLDLRDFHVLGNVEEGGSIEDDVMKKYVRHACLSTLFSALRLRMRVVVAVNPSLTTMTCHSCGHVTDWDNAMPLTLVCDGCDMAWDQDVNAARNLLAGGGTSVRWTREPVAPPERMTYGSEPNRRMRRTLRERARKVASGEVMRLSTACPGVS